MTVWLCQTRPMCNNSLPCCFWSITVHLLTAVLMFLIFGGTFSFDFYLICSVSRTSFDNLNTANCSLNFHTLCCSVVPALDRSNAACYLWPHNLYNLGFYKDCSAIQSKRCATDSRWVPFIRSLASRWLGQSGILNAILSTSLVIRYF